MITFPYAVGADNTLIHYPETHADLDGFRDFISAAGNAVIALDTETTGLHIFGPTFGCRLVQFGNACEAWVMRVDLFRHIIVDILSRPGLRFVAHNAPFDLLVLDRTGLASLDDLGPRVFDTYILAHLIDPRSEADGGSGLGLKALSVRYVDEAAADTSKGLDATFLSLYRAWVKATDPEVVADFERRHPKRPHMAWGFTNIPIDHPLYVLYAGLDVIYTSRLLAEVGTLIKRAGQSKLATWEHAVQLVTTRMQRRGLRIDPVYTAGLVERLDVEAAEHRHTAASYGVDNVNSTAQVIEALVAMGEVWDEKTDSGAPSVGKAALLPMADLDAREWDRLERRTPNPLADAVVRAKRAKAWGHTYAATFLDLADDVDRIHPVIRSLAARTARMSVSTPPLQQLPSSDWTIRRAIIADPGMVIMGVDYRSMELRVLAALADVAEMKRAIVDGRDLHDYTATLLYGPDFTKAQRRLAKGVGLGKVFGGGPTGLAKQIGAPLEQVKYAVSQYDRVYPEVAAYSKRLQRDAGHGAHAVVTPYGRHLPLDRDRSYACVNYVVQSTARDLIASALLRIDTAGLGHHVLLPVHDELICQAPEAEAVAVIAEIKTLMESTFLGVAIEADVEDIGRGPGIYGASWGHGYGAIG